MPRYALIVGNNGYKYSVDNNCNLCKRLENCHLKSHKISCVAVGPTNYFAVVCDEDSWCHGPDDFISQMEKTSIDTIKHISFAEFFENSSVLLSKSRWTVIISPVVYVCEYFEPPLLSYL